MGLFTSLIAGLGCIASTERFGRPWCSFENASNGNVVAIKCTVTHIHFSFPNKKPNCCWDVAVRTLTSCTKWSKCTWHIKNIRSLSMVLTYSPDRREQRLWRKRWGVWGMGLWCRGWKYRKVVRSCSYNGTCENANKLLNHSRSLKDSLILNYKRLTMHTARDTTLTHN